MSCPEAERVLAIIKAEIEIDGVKIQNRERWRQVYDLCYRAVCTPSLDAPIALDILIDRMLELRQWEHFSSVARARRVAWGYAARRCGMKLFGLRAKKTTSEVWIPLRVEK